MEYELEPDAGLKPHPGSGEPGREPLTNESLSQMAC